MFNSTIWVICVRTGSCDPSMLSRLRHLGCSISVERDERRTERTKGAIHLLSGLSPAFPSASIFSFFFSSALFTYFVFFP